MLTKTKCAIAVAAAAMALSFGAQAAPDTAAAMPDAASAPSATHGPRMVGQGPHAKGHGPRHGGPRGPRGDEGPGGPGFAHLMDHLHAELKLNTQQEKAWQEAQTTSRQNFDSMRTQHEVSRKQFMDQAQKPILDLSALQAQHEQVEASDHQMRTATERAFINFYDTLTDAQKTMVSNDIKRHWKRMMHDGPRHGRPEGPPPHHGDAPPPPPPPAQGASAPMGG